MSNANIHGVDHNSNYNNNYNNQYSSGQEGLFNRSNYKGDPRAQSIISYLKEAICPFFSFKSFSFIIIVVNIIIYIISLIPNGLSTNDYYFYFLPPSDDTLELFGNLHGFGLREKPEQVYRWITHNFLHASFEHIMSNCFGILIFGTILEHIIGTWKYIIIYMISGILGGLFSVLIKPEVKSVGASICCYGLIGALLGFDMINWKNLERIYGTKNRCMILMFPIIMIIFTIPLSFSTQRGSGVGAFSNDRINFVGHVGGIIFGFFLSLFILKPKENTDSCGFDYKIYFYSGIAAVASFTIIGFLCFYLLDHFKR